MFRKIRVCLDQIEDTTDGYKNISLYNLEKIVNDSCDVISIDILEYMNMEQSEQIIKTVISKLRPGGYIALSFINFKKLCYEYHCSLINSDILISHFKNKNAIIDIYWINDIIKNYNCNIVNMLENDYKISLSIQKA